MSARLIGGTPYVPNQDDAVQSDVSCTLSNEQRAVHVTASGVTVKLPPNPKFDQRHRVLALAGDVTVDGNGHVVQNSAIVPSGFAVDFVFSVLGTWVPLVGVYSPSLLYLTGFHSSSYPGADMNWPGTPSAGPSGDADRAAHPEGVTPMATGAPLNGFLPAQLVSTVPASSYFHSGELGVGTMGQYFSATTASFFYVVDPDETIYDSAPVLHQAYVLRDTSAYLGLRFRKFGTISGQKAIDFQTFYSDTQFAVAEKLYTVGPGHVPFIITGRIADGIMQLGVNEVPGAEGGFTSVPFPGAIPAAGLANTLEVGFFQGSGMTGRLFDYGKSNVRITDAQFRNILRFYRAKYGLPFLP